MPNTIAQNLQRLQQARTAIANSIVAKGGTVPTGDGLEEFAADISTIAPYEMTGELPLVFKSDGEELRDYAVYGKNVRTAQLFDKDTVTVGKYVSHMTGNLTDADGANASDYIDVGNAEYIYISGVPDGLGQWAAFYDNSKNFVRGFSEYNRSIEVPQNAKFVRITVLDGELDNLMLNQGSEALPYEPYYDGIGERTVNLLPPFPDANTMISDIDIVITNGRFTASGTSDGSLNYTYNANKFTLPAGTYTFSYNGEMSSDCRFYFRNYTDGANLGTVYRNNNATFTIDETKEVGCYFNIADSGVVVDVDCYLMLNTGTIQPFEPYGYKIPITCGNTTTNLYTPSKLYEGDTLTYAQTGVDIPTVDGVNTLDTTLNTKFSMDIQYGDFPIYDNINAAINTLKGTETTYKPADMADAILDAIPTEEVTDDIVSVTDAAAYPAEALEFAIEPVQDLHGYDRPWPAGGGKNLLPMLKSPGTNHNVTSANNNDGSFSFSGLANSSGGRNDPSQQTSSFLLKAGTYIMTLSTQSSTPINPVLQEDSTVISSNLNTPITISENKTVNVGFNHTGGIDYDGKPQYVQLELGSTATTWTPYANECPINGWTGVNGKHSGADITQYSEIPITFPTEAGTVYGGKVDVVNGKLTAYPEYDSYNGETLTGEWISSMDAYVEGMTPTIGAQVVDLSGVGTEYDITPQQVQMLLGNNNVWCDTGDTTLEYKVDLGRFISKLQAAQATPQLSLSRAAVSLDAPMDESTQNGDKA